MKNQMIGIAGVFAFTLFLFLLRHFYLSLGRPNKRRYMIPTALPGNHEMHKKPASDDDWLLWTKDSDQQGSSNRVDDGMTNLAKK
jgi:hypothetical protein